MNYLISSLKKANLSIHIISFAVTNNKHFCHFPKLTLQLDSSEKITYIDTFGGPTILIKFLSWSWKMLQIHLFLLLQVKKNDTILVYHSLSFYYPIKIVSKFRNIKLIFEVEELYNAGIYSSEKKKYKEIRYLKKGNGFILINDLIGNLCGFTNKPNIVCYGAYHIQNQDKSSFKDGKIHIIYAGKIGEEGSDVYLAVETMLYLDDNYVLHVLGYGSEQNLKNITTKIISINSIFNNAKIIFHGCLTGDAFIQVISKCDIGLNTRIFDDDLSNYTFPSKLIVYLANNLITISSRISCIEHSRLNQFVVFYNENNPSSVANAILNNIKNETNKVQPMLNSLDIEFISNLKNLFYLESH